MSEAVATAAGRHWFYDSKILVAAFCLLSIVAIFWQVSRFEGFEPIFTCASERDLDRGLLSMGVEACMADARSQAAQSRCMHVSYLLACKEERWR
ncbi:hypothetical protein ACLBX9_20090 [Methylobacterium sp. A49B]